MNVQTNMIGKTVDISIFAIQFKKYYEEQIHRLYPPSKI